MAATAPFCNVTVFTPPPKPVAPKGFKTVPLNATLEQVIRIINDNFSPPIQDDEFVRRLANDIAKDPGFTTKPSQVRRAAQQEISRLAFVETAIVRKKVKVMNPEDEEQYVIDSRVVSLIMTDKRTGASWVFSDPKASDPAG